jgi:hypothetical protein
MAAINSDRAALGLAFDSGRGGSTQLPVDPSNLQPVASSSTSPASQRVHDGLVDRDGEPSQEESLGRRRSSAPSLPPLIITHDMTSKNNNTTDLTDSDANAAATKDSYFPPVSESPPQHLTSIIPPPPSPRRHRTGAIMSRVRAHSGGPAAGAFSSSKSFGDLRNMGLTMTTSTLPVAGSTDRRSSLDDGRSRGNGRIMSAEGRLVDEPEDVWEREDDAGALDNRSVQRFASH